jgi:RNA polymerase sigma factor (sigma-70 family)
MTVSDAPTLQSATTTELLRIAVDGDHAAWHELVQRFEPAVAAMITAYRLQEADARDAAQLTWLQMLEHHQQIREPEALGGWLRTTAKRECLRIIRAHRWTEPIHDADGAECPDTTVDVERWVIDADTARELRRLMEMLPARYLALISSLFQDDPPCYAELALNTGIPVGSIGPTRARALHRLRRLIEDEWGSSWGLQCGA